jgi:hypothetical protein
VIISDVDPSWATAWADNTASDNPPEIDFLLKKEGDVWKVVTAGSNWDPDQFGAPGDLAPPPEAE